MHDIETLLDNNGVQRGNHRGGDAESDADHGDLGAIKEDADEEASRNDSAGGENAQRGTGTEEEERGADGEGEDHAASDLVEGCINVFEGIIAEAIDVGVGRDGKRLCLQEGDDAAHLSPMTFRPTMGINPLQTCMSS